MLKIPFLAPALGTMFAMAAGALITTSDSAAQTGADSSKEPVLLELFTSQGCSSCPPADHLAQQLDKAGDAVVISRPVTYWDRLGWKDTLAKESNTRLQQAYSRRGLEGRNGVYTPQVVTNGQLGVVGSRERELRRHIAAAEQGQTAFVRSIPLKNGGVSIGIAGKTQKPAELVLMAVTRKAKTNILRGENAGRSIAYTNVLRSEKAIGDWSGGKKTVVIASQDLSVAGADRYAVVLREPAAGKVLAARWIK